MKRTRVRIIEDNRDLHDGIAGTLRREAEMPVVKTIGSGNNVLLKAGQTKPHVILLDAGLKNLQESSVVESIIKQMPEVKVIGMGFIPSPAKPVILGVSFTICHVSSFSSIFTSKYPGKILR